MNDSSPKKLVASVWPVAILCVLVVVAGLLGSLGPGSLDQTALVGVVTVVLTVGVYSFVGTSGVISLGHMSFMAVGGYTAAILSLDPEIKPFQLPGLPDFLMSAHLGVIPATLAGGVVAAIVALIISPPLMRMSGLTAGLATVSLLVIVRVLAQNAQGITGGSAGLAGIPTGATMTVVLVFAVLAIIVVAVFQGSALGLRLRSSREDEVAARSLGISVVRERTAGWVLSGFLVGIGGALFVQVTGTATPDQFYLSITFLVIAMLVVGGTNSLAGAVVGAVVIAVAQELLRRVEGGLNLGAFHLPGRPGLAAVGLALVMLLVLARRPAGITRGREIPLPRWLRDRSTRNQGGGDPPPAPVVEAPVGAS
jgi:branched-chain amino acid transport system permease protein